MNWWKNFKENSRDLIRRKSITRRWMFNTLGAVFVVLVVIVVAVIVATRNYYYSSAKQVLENQADVMSSLLLKYEQDTRTNYTAEVRNMVVSFNEKDRMELMAIDLNGKIVLTSSGFSYDAPIDLPDYNMALNSTDERGSYIGEMTGGEMSDEKIVSVCMLVSNVEGEFSALRFVASMTEIDKLVWKTALLLVAVSFGILAFVGLSGAYFIKSIVLPVRQVGAAAGKIASGDYETRLVKNKDDEMGELCDTINHMADELAQSERMKNEFISSVSHELRTPLTAIKGWAETLETSGPQDTETIRKGMQVILGETERLSGMVEELLDFSRIANGRFTLNKAKMDILAELGEAVLIYEEKARREKIDFTYSEPEMLPFVFGDRNRLKQVFINVIDNALKYSDPGGSVRVEALERDGMIVIVVADSGCGISEQDLPHVKQKFYKANLTRRGSGIGLAVASEIVELHGGTLDIVSKEGVGTTVTIKIPAMPKEESKSPSETSSGAGGPAAGSAPVVGSGPIAGGSSAMGAMSASISPAADLSAADDFDAVQAVGPAADQPAARGLTPSGMSAPTVSTGEGGSPLPPLSGIGPWNDAPSDTV